MFCTRGLGRSYGEEPWPGRLMAQGCRLVLVCSLFVVWGLQGPELPTEFVHAESAKHIGLVVKSALFINLRIRFRVMAE